MSETLNKNQEIGKRIRGLRNERGLKLKDMVELTGISIGHLSDIERGESAISAEKIASIAKALGCSTDYLLTGVEEERSVPVRVEFPRALSDAALELEISYAQTLQLLEGRQSLIARRSRGAESDDWSKEQWIEFYERVEHYL